MISLEKQKIMIKKVDSDLPNDFSDSAISVC